MITQTQFPLQGITETELSTISIALIILAGIAFIFIAVHYIMEAVNKSKKITYLQ